LVFEVSKIKMEFKKYKAIIQIVGIKSVRNPGKEAGFRIA
jgi:hypothetical protein